MSDLHRNSRQLIQRRFRQTDRLLLKSIKYLASMRATVDPQYAHYAYSLFRLICHIEKERIAMLALYRMYCGGPETGMRQPGEVIEVLESAQPIPNTIRG